MSAWKTRGEYLHGMRDRIGPGPDKAGLEQIVEHHSANHGARDEPGTCALASQHKVSGDREYYDANDRVAAKSGDVARSRLQPCRAEGGGTVDAIPKQQQNCSIHRQR